MVPYINKISDPFLHFSTQDIKLNVTREVIHDYPNNKHYPASTRIESVANITSYIVQSLPSIHLAAI